MTDEMVWALREKLAKGATVPEMSRAYGIPQRVIAAVTGGKCHKNPYWKPADLWMVRELLRNGHDLYEVADEFGVAYHTIAHVVHNNPDLFRVFDRRG
jgi:hypothetical protein